MWSNQASEQIEAIHSMKATGQRSIYMERHTLFYWGIVTAALILFIPSIFNDELFPQENTRAIFSTITISVILLLTGYLDFKKVKQLRETRDETISFIQFQITKVWWLLISLIVLLNLAMHFFGGGYMFYGLLLIIMGIALYIHGLFSKQTLSHAGIIMILFGLASIGLRFPHYINEWLSIICFGIGWPLLAFSFHWDTQNNRLYEKLLFNVIWIAIIVTPTAIIYNLNSTLPKIVGEPISLEEFQQQTLPANNSETIISIPKGSKIPINIEITGDVLKEKNRVTLPLELSKNIDLILKDNQLDGRFRVSQGVWKEHRYNYKIKKFALKSELNKNDGLQVHLKLHISTNN